MTDTDAARLPACQYRHINVHGHYSFALPGPGGNPPALRDPGAPGEEQGRGQGKPGTCDVT